MIKILNLYAGIGGNRKLWKGDIEVTAIEIDDKIAKIYQDFFPNDKVIVTDAHQYLLEHYKEFDFIWSSPPCPSHSRFKVIWVKNGTQNPVYPDMKLYEEIIFLQKYFKGKYVVENVRSYYEPLVKPQEAGRHYFWANFPIKNKKIQTMDIRYGKTEILEKKHKIDLSKANHGDKRHLLRNCVDPELGLHIFKSAFTESQKQLSSFQLNLLLNNAFLFQHKQSSLRFHFPDQLLICKVCLLLQYLQHLLFFQLADLFFPSLKS